MKDGSTHLAHKEAQRNYQLLDYADFRVVTNLRPVQATAQVQEFLTRLVPEPNTHLLIGLSFVGPKSRPETRNGCPQARLTVLVPLGYLPIGLGRGMEIYATCLAVWRCTAPAVLTPSF